MEEKQRLTEEVAGLRIEWNHSDSWTDFEVFYAESGETRRVGDPLLKGHIKWDGCSEVEWLKKHSCGPFDVKQRIGLLKHIHKKVAEFMPSYDELEWDETPDPWES